MPIVKAILTGEAQLVHSGRGSDAKKQDVAGIVLPLANVIGCPDELLTVALIFNVD
ncbi:MULTISPECIES: hypothetical protein [unclassified Mesorhizobium]|uniref:hypothetical protein n=1 Tax=unclassified Mesorhizobium TaxID=325217 RepID=UPI0015C77D86|nr:MULTISPECIES: hypothetical protein [unclassified Mesorhizobium]